MQSLRDLLMALVIGPFGELLNVAQEIEPDFDDLEDIVCSRTDWPCHNPRPHIAPFGCVHYSETGSDIDYEINDEHSDGGHG